MRRRQNWPGTNILKHSLDNCKCSSIPHFVTEKQSSKFLPAPSIPKTNLNHCHQTSAAACHLCSCCSQFWSRSWCIFARWILVASMGCEDESNNTCYRRRDVLHYFIQHIILGQFWLNSEGWFLSIQMRATAILLNVQSILKSCWGLLKTSVSGLNPKIFIQLI